MMYWSMLRVIRVRGDWMMSEMVCRRRSPMG